MRDINITGMLISKSKKNYLAEYFQEKYNNSKIIQTKINELLNNKHKNSSEVFINKQSCIITDHEILANKFNNDFVNIAQNLLKGLRETNNKFQYYLKTKIKTVSFSKKLNLLKKVKFKNASQLNMQLLTFSLT